MYEKLLQSNTITQVPPELQPEYYYWYLFLGTAMVDWGTEREDLAPEFNNFFASFDTQCFFLLLYDGQMWGWVKIGQGQVKM